jgi:hypothetical protein
LRALQVSNSGELKSSGRQFYFFIPKVLLCSQLPADTTYPLDISLRVLPPPDGQEGEWAARISKGKERAWRVWLNAGHPLSAYVGRSISKMSLSQDRQLTLTFAETAAAAAATPQQAASEVAPNADLSHGVMRTQGQHRCTHTHRSAARTPAAAGEQSASQALQAPYSPLVSCHNALCKHMSVAAFLCTDIAGVSSSSSSGSGTAAVQVTVEVHAASWDVEQYILSQLQQQAPAGQQQGQLPGAQPEPGPEVFGPYAATLSKYQRNGQLFITWMQHQQSRGELYISRLQDRHEPQTFRQHLAGHPHQVVLQERVSAGGRVVFTCQMVLQLCKPASLLCAGPQ